MLRVCSPSHRIHCTESNYWTGSDPSTRTDSRKQEIASHHEGAWSKRSTKPCARKSLRPNQLDALKTTASSVGLEINTEKTEQMRLSQPADNTPTPLHIDGQPIKIVDDFKYLGSYVGSTDKDVNNRIALAWGAFNKLITLLTARSNTNTLPLRHRMRLFNAACITVLLYGCESWVLSAQPTRRLRQDLLPHSAHDTTVRDAHHQQWSLQSS